MNSFSFGSVKKYIFSVLVSILATVVVLALVSIIFSFFPPAPWLINTITDYGYILPLMISAFLCARASSGKGLIRGVITAVFCLLLISFPPMLFLKRLPLGIVSGSIGGILGINSK